MVPRQNHARFPKLFTQNMPWCCSWIQLWLILTNENMWFIVGCQSWNFVTFSFWPFMLPSRGDLCSASYNASMQLLEIPNWTWSADLLPNRSAEKTPVRTEQKKITMLFVIVTCPGCSGESCISVGQWCTASYFLVCLKLGVRCIEILNLSIRLICMHAVNLFCKYVIFICTCF
jgi:hypothetical protein